jgi:hypothetical protein
MLTFKMTGHLFQCPPTGWASFYILVAVLQDRQPDVLAVS